MPLFYKHVRHPLYIGWAISFWATPTMTVGHLLFAGVMTAYMALAAIVEERDLIAHFGHQYEHYRQRSSHVHPALERAARDFVQGRRSIQSRGHRSRKARRAMSKNVL